MKLKPIHFVAGIGVFFLLGRKKKTLPPKSLVLQSTQNASKASLQLSTRPGGEGLSAQSQKEMLKRALHGLEVSPPKAKIEGIAPFNLSDNRPDARQVAILYSIDPTFEITDQNSGKTAKASDLLPDALWEDATLRSIAEEVDQAERIAKGLSLLPENRLLEFTSGLITHAVPVFEGAGVGMEYACCLRILSDGLSVQDSRRLGRVSLNDVESWLDRNRLTFRAFVRDIGARDAMMEYVVLQFWNVITEYMPRKPKYSFESLTASLRFLTAEVARRASESSREGLSYEQRQLIYDYEVRRRTRGGMTVEQLHSMDQDLFEKGLYDKPHGGALIFLFGEKPDAMVEMEGRAESITKKYVDDVLESLARGIKK